MALFVLRRFLIFVASLLAASVIVFAVLSVLPGDPATVILGTQATPESVANLRTELGLDRSIPVQYLDWSGSLIRGDLGTSYINRLPIGAQIADRLTVTIPLALMGIALAVFGAIPAGILAAARHRKATDTVISTLSQLGLAVPAFWAGLVFVTFLAVRWKFFPAGGFPGWSGDFWGSIRALVLPSVSLALVQGAILTRYVRSAVLDVMNEDFIRTARAKGLTRTAALWRHGLRNAAIPVVTILGLQLAALLAGTVVIESVFVLPGLGNLLLQGIARRDLLLVQGAAFVIAAFILFVNLVVDLSYPLIDPRVRRR